MRTIKISIGLALSVHKAYLGPNGISTLTYDALSTTKQLVSSSWGHTGELFSVKPFIVCPMFLGSIFTKMTFLVPALFRESVHNQTVVVGEKATLECNVEGDNPIRVTWLRNEKSLQTDDNVFKVIHHSGQCCGGMVVSVSAS